MFVALRGEKNLGHANKTGPWYLFGVLIKISEISPSFIYGISSSSNLR